MRYRETLNQLDRDLQKIDETYSYYYLEEKNEESDSDKKGMRSVKYGADENPKVSKMDFLPAKVLKKIAKDKESDVNEEEDDLNEKKRRKRSSKKRRPGNPDYYKGTRKSNRQMSREIKKCTQPNPPKSCYDEWSADKTYKKSKKNEEVEEIKSLISEVIETELKERKSSKLSDKTRKTLKKKAENANMPLGALTSVYRKGLAAWLTGHRQGIPQHQWAMARVISFIRGGKTRSVDTAEWKKVQAFRKKK